MGEERFYLNIGDWMYSEEHWFKTEDELKNYVEEVSHGDTFGLNITALEVNRVINL